MHRKIGINDKRVMVLSTCILKWSERVCKKLYLVLVALCVAVLFLCKITRYFNAAYLLSDMAEYFTQISPTSKRNSLCLTNLIKSFPSSSTSHIRSLIPLPLHLRTWGFDAHLCTIISRSVMHPLHQIGAEGVSK